MPKKSTKTKAGGSKRNLKVEDLPKSQQKVGKKEMKKVKGGVVICRGPKKDILPCV